MAGLFDPSRRALTVGLVLTITFVASEALAVITVMPIVAEDLSGLRLYGWVFSGFMLGSLVGIVAAGRAADHHGPARPYAAGLLLFTSGLAIAGLAPTMEVLVVGRVLQGVGAGAIPAIAYVAIGRTLPETLRAHMMAVLSTAWVLPGLVGPALSAEVANLFGWRWVFLGLLPVVAAAGPLALPALLRLGPPTETPAAGHRLLDGLQTAVGVGLVLAGVTVHNWILAVVVVVGGALLSIRAVRRLLPDGTLTARPGLPTTILSRGLLTFALFGADAYVTLSIVNVRHGSVRTGSLVVTAATLAWTAGAWVQARLNTVWGGGQLVRVGLTLVLTGIVGMEIVVRPGVPLALAVVSWTIAGFGIGLAYAPISLMMLREAPAGREGWASASLNLSDVLGQALGIGLAGAAVAAASVMGWPQSTGVSLAFAIAATGAIAGLLVSSRLPNTPTVVANTTQPAHN